MTINVFDIAKDLADPNGVNHSPLTVVDYVHQTLQQLAQSQRLISCLLENNQGTYITKTPEELNKLVAGHMALQADVISHCESLLFTVRNEAHYTDWESNEQMIGTRAVNAKTDI